MKYTKPPLSISDQIALLQSRGLILGDVVKAGAALKHKNYYRLRGYWLPFEADPKLHKFQPGTTLEAVLDLYEFDRRLRLLVMDAVERGISVRTCLAYCLVMRYGSHAYLDASRFHDPVKHAVCLQKLQEEV